MGSYLLFTTFLILITLFLTLKRRQSRNSGKQQPPGPTAWPVVGNLFDLGSHLNQNLYKLRFKYGDLLWLRLGWSNTLVIQTSKAAEQLFKNHDTSFCNRKISDSFTVHDFHRGAIALNPYGSNWRILRRLVTLGLMTNKQIQDTRFIREKCIDNMIRSIEEDSAAAQRRGESGEIEFAKYLFTTTFNLMGNLVLSRDLVNPQADEEGNEFFNAMGKVMVLAGKPNLADFFHFLERFDPQRVKKNMELYIGQTLSILEKFVKERTEDRKLMKEKNSKDMLDTLLEYNESGDDGRQGYEAISTHHMLVLIAEMFFAGTESTSATIEWVMTELFRNPESMRKVKEELNSVVGPQRNVEESDLNELPYFHAVIKETMRLHPVVPMLIPRATVEDTNFMGYLIPKDTRVLVNAWAIGRDPDVWEDPSSFKPERFIGSNVEYRGLNFELIPFGAGRRVCVGFPLAHQMVHLTAASLLHSFDWEIESKTKKDAMDISERFGITVRKLIPLKAIPKKKIVA